jgi:hypothetical protein
MAKINTWVVSMVRVRRADLPPAPIVVVTLTDGTDEVDERVLQLAHAEAADHGLRIGAYFGILDEPDAGLLCHVFTATDAT